MAESNSSMMMVMVMIIGMVMSSVLSAGAGLIGYNQGLFDDILGTEPPVVEKTDEDEDKDKDTDKSSSIPTGKSIYIYSKNCTKGNNWHRFLSARRQDDKKPWMHCKKDGDYTVWELEKTSTWYYYIKNRKTKKYLTETEIDGIRTIKISDKDGDKSRWAIKKQKDATNEYAIRNKSSSKVLNIHGNDCKDWQRSDVSGESVIRLDDTGEDTNVSESARWKIAQPSYTDWTKIVPSSEANCGNDR